MFDDIIGKKSVPGTGSGTDDVLRKKYLSDPNFCPFCGFDTFTVDGDADLDMGNTVEIKVRCDDCGRRWTDVIELQGSEPVVINVIFE